MKICRFNNDRVGIVRGDLVYDITAHAGDALVPKAPKDLEKKFPKKKLKDVKLLSPVKAPGKIVAAPVNYKAHIEEMAKSNISPGHNLWDIEKAGLFMKANSSLVGASHGIEQRFLERRTDFEVELVAIIGKKASHVSKEKALDYVAGYCLGLDITVRGTEDRSFRKSIDSYSVLGPWMVTADEIPDPDDVPLTISVNGEVKQNSNTKQLIYDCRKLIEWGSTFYTFYPGDVLFTGTPEGVSPVKPGDVMRAEIPAIGVMSVAVRAHKAG